MGDSRFKERRNSATEEILEGRLEENMQHKNLTKRVPWLNIQKVGEETRGLRK